jgi:hypothetical protein
MSMLGINGLSAARSVGVHFLNFHFLNFFIGVPYFG